MTPPYPSESVLVMVVLYQTVCTSTVVLVYCYREETTYRTDAAMEEADGEYIGM